MSSIVIQNYRQTFVWRKALTKRSLKRLPSARYQLRAMAAPPIVDAKWLHSKIAEPSTKILDASWYLPPMGRDPIAEYKAAHIPGAQFFDINTVADPASDLPHMLPSEAGFAAAADALGIGTSDHVIVYDGMGLFSAARAWWLFKVFGHKDISVLDGGFPAWKQENYEVESGENLTEEEIMKATIACKNAEGKTRYPATLDRQQVRDLEGMLELLESKNEQIIDARSVGRFEGTQPEFRKNLRSGHIPGSFNIPFGEVLTQDGHLKSKEELVEVIKNAGVDLNKNIVCSCGSGTTAAIVALALDVIGFDQKVAIYDGSWSEWGSFENVPVEVGKSAKPQVA